MLDRIQAKSVKQSFSFFAFSRLLLAGAVLFIWGRSIVGTFDKWDGSKRQQGLILPTVSHELKTTPEHTATPWVIINNSPPVIVYVPTPAPTATPMVDDKAWIANIDKSKGFGWATKPSRDPDMIITGKISYYWPPWAYEGGKYEINCDKVNGVLECEHMANGEHVVDWVGEAVACPEELPFGTVVSIFDGYFTCRDRGGAITRIDDDTMWFDVLFDYLPAHYWGEETQVLIWFP